MALGIDLGSDSTSINVQGNRLLSNTAALTDSGTTDVVANNLGYNPVGVTAAANVCTSPCTITAGASPETHYLNQSATNTATVAVGSQKVATLIGTTSYWPIDLGPNESMVVTWATTDPTDTKYVHE